MRVLCQYESGRCSQCGKAMLSNLKRRCDAGPEKAPARPVAVQRDRTFTRKAEAYGLGTLVENALAEVGITPDRWMEFKKKMGLPATCNCGRRKAYLNQLSEELGEKAKTAVSKLLGFG